MYLEACFLDENLLLLVNNLNCDQSRKLLFMDIFTRKIYEYVLFGYGELM